jgi:hypothetical protein
MWVRRRNRLLMNGTAKPPAICVPAMTAAAMPATPIA